MKEKSVNRLLARVRPDRALYYYYKDRYALELLALEAGKGRPVRELKQGPLSPLLRKKAVREILAKAGDGTVNADSLLAHWPARPYCYVVTLGKWGSRNPHCWWQTSRRGHNLVVQLNFTKSHDRMYMRHIRDSYGLNCPFHPVRYKRRNTVAWARVDYDEQRNEALIEEIQTDWMRYALWDLGGKKASRGEREYMKKTLAPHFSMWAEATLAATLRFCREDLGARVIWYHTHAAGQKLRGGEPPYSLYETLPKRFCFERVYEQPAIVRPRKGRRRKEVEGYPFWRMTLGDLS